MFSACLAGLFSGLVLTGVQMVRVVPIVLEAESYEVPEPQQEGQQQGGDAWTPADGLQRSFSTAFSNVLTAMGFALLLVAIYSLRNSVGWQQGLLWGLAGYAVFFLNPSVGLMPEIPGAQAAALGARQAWWLATVVCTAIGLSALVFVKQWGWKAAGGLLLVVPHIVGAPQPDVHGGSAPRELADAFVMATAIANAIFWLALGASSAWAFGKLAPSEISERRISAKGS